MFKRYELTITQIERSRLLLIAELCPLTSSLRSTDLQNHISMLPYPSVQSHAVIRIQGGYGGSSCPFDTPKHNGRLPWSSRSRFPGDSGLRDIQL